MLYGITEVRCTETLDLYYCCTIIRSRREGTEGNWRSHHATAPRAAIDEAAAPVGYPYSYAVSVSQLAVRSLGADDCASQTRHRDQFGTYDEGASAPVRPTVLKCGRLRFPAVSGWDCHELRVSPGKRGI